MEYEFVRGLLLVSVIYKKPKLKSTFRNEHLAYPNEFSIIIRISITLHYGQSNLCMKY